MGNKNSVEEVIERAIKRIKETDTTTMDTVQEIIPETPTTDPISPDPVSTDEKDDLTYFNDIKLSYKNFTFEGSGRISVESIHGLLDRFESYDNKTHNSVEEMEVISENKSNNYYIDVSSGNITDSKVISLINNKWNQSKNNEIILNIEGSTDNYNVAFLPVDLKNGLNEIKMKSGISLPNNLKRHSYPACSCPSYKYSGKCKHLAKILNCINVDINSVDWEGKSERFYAYIISIGF